MIIEDLLCKNQHRTTCRSQLINNSMSTGHIDISAGILFSGNTFQRIKEIMNIANATFINQHSIPSKRSSFILLFNGFIQLIEHCCLKVEKKSPKSICLVMVCVTPQATMQNTGLTR